MRVDGREVTVSGNLLQPLIRRTNDIFRLVLATVFLAAVDRQLADHPHTTGWRWRSRSPESSAC